MDNLEWKVKNSKRTGPNYHEEAQAQIDPWSLAVCKAASLRLAADGWRPVIGADADATGASAGFAVMHRVTGETATERIERFWLFGNIVFINEDHNVALYVELLSGTAGERKTVAEALASVRTVPLGLRWMGSISRPDPT